MVDTFYYSGLTGHDAIHELEPGEYAPLPSGSIGFCCPECGMEAMWERESGDDMLDWVECAHCDYEQTDVLLDEWGRAMENTKRSFDQSFDL